MVYSANSYRQWLQMPGATWRRVRADPRTYVERTATEARMRVLYDANAAGDPAPQTEFVTRAELAHLCREFRGCSVAADNIDAEGPFRFLPRLFGPLLGLGLYCRLDK